MQKLLKSIHNFYWPSYIVFKRKNMQHTLICHEFSRLLHVLLILISDKLNLKVKICGIVIRSIELKLKFILITARQWYLERWWHDQWDSGTTYGQRMIIWSDVRFDVYGVKMASSSETGLRNTLRLNTDCLKSGSTI